MSVLQFRYGMQVFVLDRWYLNSPNRELNVTTIRLGRLASGAARLTVVKTYRLKVWRRISYHRRTRWGRVRRELSPLNIDIKPTRSIRSTRSIHSFTWPSQSTLQFSNSCPENKLFGGTAFASWSCERSRSDWALNLNSKTIHISDVIESRLCQEKHCNTY